MTDTVKSALNSWQGILAIISIVVSAALFVQTQILDRPTRIETQAMIDQSLSAIIVQLQNVTKAQEEDSEEIKEMIQQLQQSIDK